MKQQKTLFTPITPFIQSTQCEENITGLPAGLKAGLETLSGMDMSCVRVHRNSTKPAALNAYAYTQGTDIYLGPGREKHLAHEAWHVVQQAQGRVRPTIHMAGLPVNDNHDLENEATRMGIIAHKVKEHGARAALIPMANLFGRSVEHVIQRASAGWGADGVTRRDVFKSRRDKKWYSDYDLGTPFESKEDAKRHHRTYVNAEIEKKAEQDAITKTARLEKRKQELKDQFGDYEPPKSNKVRLFKEQDKAHDDVDIVKLDYTNVKKFMEASLAQRRAGEFKTVVIDLDGNYYVMAPGTDIGLTPAMLRPDLADSDGNIPMSREGQPKTYAALANGLDKLASKLSINKRTSLPEIRERMGKDIMRMTRGNPPENKGDYTKDELRLLNELAVVLRLDKGRVPDATDYIRRTLTEGNHSFGELFVQNKYVGAGQGGVEKLRQQVEPDGYESAGSDIEGLSDDEKRRKKKKRRPSSPR